MGASDLRDVCYLEEINDEDIEGCNVVIDGNNWIYKYISSITKYNQKRDYTNQEDVELPNLIGVPQGLSRFSDLDINPFFVFDGGYNHLKQEEINRRREKRNKAEEKSKELADEGDMIKSSLYESRSQTFNKDMLKTTTELMDILDINYMIAPKSAESQAAYMVKNYQAYKMSLSSDYDSILFGCPFTLRNFVSSRRNKEMMELSKTLNKNDISREQLVDIAILCGCDYNDGVKGVGPKTAVKEIKKNGRIEDLDDEILGELVDNYDEVRKIFLNPEVSDDFSENPGPLNPNRSEAKEYIESLDVRVEENSIDNLEWSQSGLDRFV